MLLMVCAAPSYPTSKQIAVTDRRYTRMFTIVPTMTPHVQISGYGSNCK